MGIVKIVPSITKKTQTDININDYIYKFYFHRYTSALTHNL